MTGTRCLAFVWGSRPGSRDVINWQWRDVIRAQSICYCNNKYLHDVPSVCLLKTVQHRQDSLPRWLIKFKTQYNLKTGPQTDDIWRILWRQRECEVVATNFLRRPYATPEWRWFWHANKIYGITGFMLSGLYRNMPVFLEDNFLILEHKVSFGFVPYPSSVLIYKKSSTGKTGLDSPTVMSVERSATKGQSPRLPPTIPPPFSAQTASNPFHNSFINS